MSNLPSQFQLRDQAQRIVCHVLDTMLHLKATPTATQQLPRGNRICGSLGLAGDHVAGSAYLHLPEPLARIATGALLEIDPTQIEDEAQVNDVVGELSNMIVGGFKSALCDAGLACAMSTPSIVRGQDFAIELQPSSHSEIVTFDCQNHQLAFEIHLKVD